MIRLKLTKIKQQQTTSTHNVHSSLIWCIQTCVIDIWDQITESFTHISITASLIHNFTWTAELSIHKVFRLKPEMVGRNGIVLTHCGLMILYVTYMYMVIIGSGNGLVSVQCQASTWTNADVFSIEHLRNKLHGEIWIKLKWFSFRELHLICHGFYLRAIYIYIYIQKLVVEYFF